MVKVSILMPAYNAEKYIASAIESIIQQSYTDWELIIVDDCSPDKTADICMYYMENDARIKLYRNEKNCGISKNKNIALALSTGKYIAFCDDDDVMTVDSLKDNVALAEKYEADVVRWSYRTVKIGSDNTITEQIDRKCHDSVYLSRDEMFEDYSNIHELLSCDWTALYKREMIERYNITFNTEYKFGGEDTDFNIQVLEYVNKMVMNSNIYYYWNLRRNHSTTAKRNINFCYTMMQVAYKEYMLLKTNNRLNMWSEYALGYEKLIFDYSKRLSKYEQKLVNEKMNVELWRKV